MIETRPYDDLSNDDLLAMDAVCEEFEQALRKETAASIESHLEAIPSAIRTAVFRELLATELEWRTAHDQVPDISKYQARFPANHAEIRQAFFEAGRSVLRLAKESSPSQPSAGGACDLPSSGHPQRIGRYTLEKIVGKGSFGLVYRAHDDQLDRVVAIKVPHDSVVSRREDLAPYLAEAQTVASLDHPNIVPVFDVGGTEEFPCYVVSRYIDGTDLATRLNQSRLSLREAVELVATVAEALHHAHKRGLVHRDIKPGNILLDRSGKSFVADFGLVLREKDVGMGPRYAGTPAYMSPEQARGEGHRVDGRSDIFSLGVIFYELLVGRPPFRASSQEELLEQVATFDPPPPRQLDDAIPKEVDRICLKALSKRASERYSTARDMADDLRHFLSERTIDQQSGPDLISSGSRSTTAGTSASGGLSTSIASSLSRATSATTPISNGSALKIVPKGLRSFDAHDADFFLELVPGPRDRDGLPEGIRFWKTRIEEMDADNTFAVGLLYGPSGCGKSSLVKAGLLPRLSDEVIAVYVEATAAETEPRLLNGLRKRCPVLPPDLGLKETLAALRRDQGAPAGKKVLIVLDQFEQWLHAKKVERNSELVQSLRQCDGGRVQCIVMVRDDFWLAVSRFLKELEVRLLEGQNSALVDLFDMDHARKILAAFGRAFGKLPENARETAKEQKEFLKQAVSGLAEEGKVISVRLALFAEMLKGKLWVPATLKEAGGTEGVGVAFLEETFSAATAPPEHRYHQKAARAVLKSLLPEAGTDIKGHMRSQRELLVESGCASHPGDFDDLLRILDSEVRLITPTDPEGKDEGGWRKDEEIGAPPADQGSSSSVRYYQLTHDYLVPSLREWLTRKQKETRRGRAELRLVERSVAWKAKPENRHLASLWEWGTIRLLTDKKTWTGPERRMIERAGWLHGLRALGMAAGLALIVVVGLDTRRRVLEHNEQTVAGGLVNQVIRVKIAQVPDIVKSMGKYRRWVDPALRRLVARLSERSEERLHASIALLPVDDGQVDYLYNWLLEAHTDQVTVLRGALKPHQGVLTPKLWPVLESSTPGDLRLLPAASALALYDPEDPRWAKAAGNVAVAMAQVNAIDLRPWLEALRPVHSRLTAPLATIFRDNDRPGIERSQATNILTDYVSDDPKLIAGLLMDADPKAYAAFFPIAQGQAATTLSLFQEEVARNPLSSWDERAKDELAQRQARAAVALVRLGRPEEVWPLLQHSADPRLRSFVVNWLNPLGADAGAVASGLERIVGRGPPDPAPSRVGRDTILFHPQTSIRRALILALGTYHRSALSPGECEAITAKMLDAYTNDPDAGIHGAAEWTLRQWNEQASLKAAEAQLMKLKDRGDRRWFVNSQGQTYSLIEGPVEFTMGGAPFEPDRDSNEVSHRRLIPRRFAIAAKELSVREYQEFVRENPEFGLDPSTLDKYSPDPDGPMISVSWFGAVACCNWLSKRERLPEAEWCYLRNANAKYDQDMTIPADVLKRQGYRLPTEAEWEYACRAGATTSRYYGLSLGLLGNYACHAGNSAEHAWPRGALLPNDLGLFDMLGNVCEWCGDRVDPYPAGRNKTHLDNIDTREHVDVNPRLLRGGAFLYRPPFVRSACRYGNVPTYRVLTGGFRPVRTYPPEA